jgi:hypothetical protein
MVPKHGFYPLVNVYITIWKITMFIHFSWVNPLFRLGHGFNSYVKLPEGISHEYPHYLYTYLIYHQSIIYYHNGPNMAFTNDLSMGAPKSQDDPIRVVPERTPRLHDGVRKFLVILGRPGRWLPRYLMYYTNYT